MSEANADAQAELNRILKENNERYRVEEDRRKRENDELIRLNDTIEEEMKQIVEDYNQNKRQVTKMLMDQILIVNIEVPKVVQQKFE